MYDEDGSGNSVRDDRRDRDDDDDKDRQARFVQKMQSMEAGLSGNESVDTGQQPEEPPSTSPSTPPSTQTPDNPNGYHCDINSFNRAEEQGYDGGDWDGNWSTVDDIVNENYSDDIEDDPPPDSAGYGVADLDEDPEYDHMYYYEYDGGDEIDIWDSNGIEDQTHEALSINDSYIQDSDFIPLDPRD